MYTNKIAIIVLLSCISIAAFSQQHASEEGDFLRLKDRMAVNTITVAVGRAYDIFSGEALSNIGADYLRRFAPKWELGLQLDVDYKKDFVQFEGVQVAAIVAFSVTNKWPVFAGFGVEGQTDHTAGFFRIGTEYTFFLDKKQMFFFAPGTFIDMETVTPSIMIA